MLEKLISFIIGCMVILWILGFALGYSLFDIITEHGLKSVVTCVWEGEDACENLGKEPAVVEVDPEDRTSHIK